MTIYGIERTHRFGAFVFQVAYDTGNEVGLEQRDIHWREGTSEDRWVRSFYFEDVVELHIKNFCKHFAEDEGYRKAAIAQSADWAIRDSLFRRNIFPSFWQKSLLVEQLGGEQNTYRFFKKHWEAIISSETYQSIQRADSAFEPSQYELDPEIRDAVNCFNDIDGVKTKFSCQGVSQLFVYEGFSILADSPHARLAYISFEHCLPKVERILQTYAPSIASYRSMDKTFQSIGDNLRFRQLALELAQIAKHSI